MKTLVLNITFLFVSIFQMSASNAPKLSSLVSYINEKTIVFNQVDNNSEVETITIYDTGGKVVFEDGLRKYENGVKYKLNRLPVGDYTIKVLSNKYVEMIQTTITENDVLLGNSEFYYKPLLKSNDDKLFVHALFPNNDRIALRIYDDKGELVYDYQEDVLGDFQKAFNLEELVEGDYKIYVNTDYFSEAVKVSL